MTADSWTELPLSEVLYRWTAKNTGLPTEIVCTTFYVSILVAMWFALVCVIRFIRFTIMRFIWPLIVLTLALLIFGSFLRFVGDKEINNLQHRL